MTRHFTGLAGALAVAAMVTAPSYAAGGLTLLPPIDGASTFGRCLTAELAHDDGALAPDRAAMRIVLTCTGASHCPDGSCRSIDIEVAAKDLESWVLALRENSETREDCAKQAAAGQPSTGICQVVNQL